MPKAPAQTPAPVPQAAATAPPCPKCGKGGTVFAIVFLVLFIAATAAAVWFYLEGVKVLDDVTEKDNQITTLQGDISALEAEKQALQEKADSYDALTSELEADKTYRDEILEFTYSPDILLNYAPPIGADYERFFFLETNEDGVYRSTGWELTYPRSVSEFGLAATTFEELEALYTEELADVTQAETGEIRGARYIRVDGEEMDGASKTYYIETNEPTEVIYLYGAFLTPGGGPEVLKMLQETVQVF